MKKIEEKSQSEKRYDEAAVNANFQEPEIKELQTYYRNSSMNFATLAAVDSKCNLKDSWV